MATSERVSSSTLEMLGARLQRIDYALNGSYGTDNEPTPPVSSNHTAAARLHTLERQLQSLTSKSPTANEVLQLQQKHPELFKDASQSQTSVLHPTSLATSVLAHTDLYQRLSGQLSTLSDSSVPESSAFSKLAELQPRVERAAERQEKQAREFAELRALSAAAVEKWYESGVLGMGERWAEWEERMRDVEILVRRIEAAKKREGAA